MKRALNPPAFSSLLLASSGVALAPIGVILLWLDFPDATGWWFILGTVLLHVLYFGFLAKSYTSADLSLAYPIARGTGPALVPVAGVLVLNEEVHPMAVSGIVSVVTGIFVIYWGGRLREVISNPLSLIKTSGTRYALLTGLTITAYAIWDKQGVQHVNSFLYMYLMLLGSAVFLVPHAVRTLGLPTLREEWRRNGPWIVAAGMLTFLAYGLVLTALTFSRVSYVAPAREVGIVLAVILGAVFLRESFGRNRVLGAFCIVLGLSLIATSP